MTVGDAGGMLARVLMRVVFLVAVLALLARPAAAEEESGPRNKLTAPKGHSLSSERPSDELRNQARQLRMRALDARDAADELRERGRGDRADDLDDHADDLEDRALQLDRRADEMDAQGENATRGMVLPAPSPSMP